MFSLFTGQPRPDALGPGHPDIWKDDHVSSKEFTLNRKKKGAYCWEAVTDSFLDASGRHSDVQMDMQADKCICQLKPHLAPGI